jgi:serine/threonine-protein kinase
LALPERNTAIFVGDYEILGRLGAGGMAEVLLARTEGSSHQVVLKRLLPKYAKNPEAARMFMDEARILSRLNHPNIVRIYDVAQANGQHYLVMEHLDGVDLRKIKSEFGGKVPIGAAVAIAMEAAAGLHYAHELVNDQGRSLELVHRDVSPANIVVTGSGEVKLIDFGIATAIVREQETRTGIVKGTHSYMCPEQVRMLPLDRRGDIYSLAVVLFELTSGLLPTRNGRHHLEGMRPVDSPRALEPSYPRELEEVLVRAMAPVADMRPATAAQFRDELAEALRAMGVTLTRQDLSELARKGRSKDDPLMTVRGTDPIIPLDLVSKATRKPTPLELAATTPLGVPAFSPAPPSGPVAHGTPAAVPPAVVPVSPAAVATATVVAAMPLPVHMPAAAVPPAVHSETTGFTGTSIGGTRRLVPRSAIVAAVGSVIFAAVLTIALGRRSIDLKPYWPEEPEFWSVVEYKTAPTAQTQALASTPAREEAADRLPTLRDHMQEHAQRLGREERELRDQRELRELRERERARERSRERERDRGERSRERERKPQTARRTQTDKPFPTAWDVDSPLPPSGGR